MMGIELDNNNNNNNTSTTTTHYGLKPPDTSSILTKICSHSLFLQTPRFLEVLIAVADDLKLLPRAEQNSELQTRLRSLELEYLPSNSIYVPVNNCIYRV
jgi:hypothetical protein